VRSVSSWDKTYKLENENFKSHGDIGEVWFGEDSALRVVRFKSLILSIILIHTLHFIQVAELK
jgi:hypothetical protein